MKFTMVSDCCHSGGMLDHKEIVISGGAEANVRHVKKAKERGISVEEVMEEMEALKSSSGKKNRAIDLQTVQQLLKDSGQVKEPQLNKIR